MFNVSRKVLCVVIVFFAASYRLFALDKTVTQAGAMGNGQADDTSAFQNAIDAVSQAGGGIVNVPAGQYRINGNLVIPANVTLQGIFNTAPTPGITAAGPFIGSNLLAYAGRGSREGQPFILLKGNNATVKGLVVTYPEWKQTDVPPVPYPATIQAAAGADNTAVIDCLLLNPYEALRFELAGRFLVRNVTGYPIFRGLYVDQCYDIGRVENVHFWPFAITYKPDDPYCQWINLNGVAFEFARTDWQYVLNTFCFGYGVGYKFSESKNGACNGNFLGIGADSCQRAVLLEQTPPFGLLITNGEFVGRWSSQDAVTLEIGEKVQGKVSLNNCAFWGPIDRCVWMRAPQGQFSAQAVAFCDWDVSKAGHAAVQVDAGKVIIQGSTFNRKGPHVQVNAGAVSAILMGNQAVGGFQVDNKAGEKTVMMGNEKE